MEWDLKPLYLIYLFWCGVIIVNCVCLCVYADQVGSAIPKLCWDSSHGHTMGGGNFWATGYQAMMDAISQSLYSPQRTPTAQEGYPMVTEDNAEPYMGMVQGMLTLNAFKASLAQAPSASLPSTSRMNPAYPMVIIMSSHVLLIIFNISDLSDCFLFPFFFRLV